MDGEDSDGRTAPELCPVCGEEVPPQARACPGCGADESTGWNTEATATDGLDLPDPSFDYEAFVARELDGQGSSASRWKTWAGIGLALAVAAGLVLLCMQGD